MKRKPYDLLPDGSLDPDQDGVSTLFERELDEIHSKQGSAACESACDRDRVERASLEWQAALAKRCQDALRGDNVDILGVTRNLDWSYRVRARDARYSHRDYSVEITVGEAVSIAELHMRAPLEAIARDCVERVREARATYERRMIS